MNRVFVYLSALVGFGGMVYLAGGIHAQPPGGAPGGAPPGAPPPATQQARPTVAVFNMAAVMRDYGKAKWQVYQLNQKRIAMSGELVKYRDGYLKCQKDIAGTADPKVKETLSTQMLNYARLIEDEDRKINKTLNDEASTIISGLYDDIKKVVDATADMNGYHLIFAYPDAVTEEEKKNPFLKELKLKPPAAQPFYVARHVDLTGIVIDTLNKWNPPVDAQGRPVDVNKLPPLEAPGTPGPAQPGTPGAAPAPGGVPGAPPGTPGAPAPGGVPGAPRPGGM